MSIKKLTLRSPGLAGLQHDKPKRTLHEKPQLPCQLIFFNSSKNKLNPTKRVLQGRSLHVKQTILNLFSRTLDRGELFMAAAIRAQDKTWQASR
jgi:hypothetical protein